MNLITMLMMMTMRMTNDDDDDDGDGGNNDDENAREEDENEEGEDKDVESKPVPAPKPADNGDAADDEMLKMFCDDGNPWSRGHRGQVQGASKKGRRGGGPGRGLSGKLQGFQRSWCLPIPC